MRDLLYITGLIALVVLLAAEFPVSATPSISGGAMKPAFASFVELSPAVHAACLESARASWQMRRNSGGRHAIGSLDSGVPLLNDEYPQREKVAFGAVDVPNLPAGPLDVLVYSLLPATEGCDIPSLTVRPQNGTSTGNGAVFGREEMISIENFDKLKEMIK